MRSCQAFSFMLSLLMMFTLHAASADELYPLPSTQQELQFKHLLSDLRCLVCQNQNLADSDAGLAHDLRMDVYRMVKIGKDDQTIIAYLTDRYGDFILLNPPLKTSTILLWFTPLIFLSLGFFLLWNKLKPSSEQD